MSTEPVSRARLFPIVALLAVLVASVLVADADKADAAFPGENGKIAFDRGEFGFTGAEIYSINPDGSGETNLTNHPAVDLRPAWSPDGTRILFSSDRDGNFEIYVMDADGSNQTRLTNDPAFDNAAAWSPDGTQIVFESKRFDGVDDDTDIYIMDADGSNQTRLTDNTAPDNAPAWSPDGSRIVFSSQREPGQPNNAEIYVMDPDGSNQTRLTNEPAQDREPNWSPDGTQIVFQSSRVSASNPGGRNEIYVMDADGSNQTALTNNGDIDDTGPAWSPDGTKITFSTDRSGDPEIYIMDADGSNQTRLTDNAAANIDDSNPDWQTSAPGPLPTTTTSTTVPPTTTTSTTLPPTTTSTTVPPPGDLVVTVDETVNTNGSRGQVSGTITCDAGGLFVVDLDLTQGDASARGTARGSCTGSPQSFTIGFATAGASFSDGPAEACVAARTGLPGFRRITDSTEVCEDVTIDVR